MASFVIYNKISEKELIKTTEDAISRVKTWFAANPRRRICNIQWVYGKMIKVRKNHIDEDINKEAEKTAKE